MKNKTSCVNIEWKNRCEEHSESNGGYVSSSDRQTRDRQADNGDFIVPPFTMMKNYVEHALKGLIRDTIFLTNLL